MRARKLQLATLLVSLFAALNGTAQSANPTKQPVATIDGQLIYEEDLASSVAGQLQPLRNQEYEIKRKALDGLIEQKMLETTAQKKGITPEKLLDQEVTSKIADPSDAEVEGYYYGLHMNRAFADVKAQLRDGLKQAKIRQAREDYLKSLRAASKIVVLLSAPKLELAYDPGRLRGDPKAPVMIVEFSDYQCPYCRQVEPTIREVLAKYGTKVSLAYRDLPLRQIHPQALIAAEASRCAEEQGKFWEYHDQLFNATKFDHEALLDFARTLKLDDRRFDSCLTTEKYKDDIDHDVREGMGAGLTGTPGFFVNGIVLSGSQPEASFSKIIDEELARK